ncbi:transposase [Staphylococcus phage vB_SauM_VL10]|nr:transposase [Staphylococcus phage vB_SauM_VL10]
MAYMSIGKFSKEIGVTTQTLRNWHSENKLIPEKITDSGTRYYSQEQLNQYKGTVKARKTVGYCRVSSKKQDDDLDRQVMDITRYMNNAGYNYQVITDIGSGINYNNKGLNELIKMIVSNEVEKIVVMYKDRLVRFGFELIENICKEFDVSIEIVDNEEKMGQQELVEDLIQIVTVFSCRLQGKRAHKAKKMVGELNSDNEKSQT